jgi:uncharacterized phage-associated protein
MKTEIVANSLLSLAKDKGETLTHLKVQKLLYFLNGWNLALNGSPLLDDEFQAWRHGPVIPSLYNELRGFGFKPIDRYIQHLDTEKFELVTHRVSKENVDFWNLLNQVWEKYAGFTALQLSTLSHEAGSPWDITPKDHAINSDVIRQYFQGKLTQ